MMKAWRMVAVVAAGVGMWGCAHAPVVGPEAQPAGGIPVLEAVYGVERPVETDAVILRDGRRIQGDLLNASVSIVTAYGRVTISRQRLAGVDCRVNAYGLRSVTTANRDRFSGFLDMASIEFRPEGGAIQSFSPGEMSKVIIGRQRSTTAGMTRNQYFVLRNGDFFSGAPAVPSLPLRTTFGPMPVRFAETEYIQFGGATGLVTVVQLNKQTVSGFSDYGVVNVALDVGGNVRIERDLLHTVYCRKGYLPPAKGQRPVAEAAKPTEAPTQAPVAQAASTKQAVPVLDLDAPAAPRAPVEFPEGMRTGGTRHKGRQANISFEDCPRDIGAAYGGVTFSGGWYAWEPPNPDYKLNGKVATADGEAKITFANPCSTFELLATSPQVDTEVVALDASGGVVAQATVSGVDKMISLRSSRADISTVEVRGEPNQWVIDDIAYR